MHCDELIALSRTIRGCGVRAKWEEMTVSWLHIRWPCSLKHYLYYQPLRRPGQPGLGEGRPNFQFRGGDGNLLHHSDKLFHWLDKLYQWVDKLHYWVDKLCHCTGSTICSSTGLKNKLLQREDKLLPEYILLHKGDMLLHQGDKLLHQVDKLLHQGNKLLLQEWWLLHGQSDMMNRCYKETLRT